MILTEQQAQMSIRSLSSSHTWPPKRTRWQRFKALLWRAVEAVQL